MCRVPPGYHALPLEYQRAAEHIFPQGREPSGEAALAFAEALGIGSDYQKALAAHQGDKELERFLGHFQNNLDLLIQKTWVEKAEERRKDLLQNRIAGFIRLIEQERYRSALLEFGAMLEELAYLFFGAQSRKEDFIEYALRIDTQMGLFWWYGGQIRPFLAGLPPEDVSRQWFRSLLFIGMCYLSNF
ncbi:MAG: hypothetical protein LBD37_02845 [Treponema sp.]|jgi:hypothetical protein|nr:hypothetical protein [Treponema sp.]